MAEKYSYADIIIDPEDPRVEIGKEYYTSKNIPDALFKANEGDEMFCYKLLSVHDGAYGPFWMDKDSPDSFDFLIRKKEPEKKYVPFDLSKEEDRAKLRGEYLIQLYTGNFSQEEKLVVGFSENTVIIGGYDPHCFNGHELLGKFTFLDGTPCGRLVEE